MKNLVNSSASNFGVGSKTCPIVSECGAMALGMAKGDMKNVAINGGILALSAPRMGSSIKIGTQSSGFKMM